MKKLSFLVLCLALCCGFVTTSVAQVRYTDLEAFSATATRSSSSKIYCRAKLSAYANHDLQIDVIVTDSRGNEIDTRSVSAFDYYLDLGEYIEVAGKGTYTCEFFFTCGSDSPSVTRTVVV